MPDWLDALKALIAKEEASPTPPVVVAPPVAPPPVVPPVASPPEMPSIAARGSAAAGARASPSRAGSRAGGRCDEASVPTAGRHRCPRSPPEDAQIV